MGKHSSDENSSEHSRLYYDVKMLLVLFLWVVGFSVSIMSVVAIPFLIIPWLFIFVEMTEKVGWSIKPR